MNLALVNVLFAAALFTLTWIVQLVIYPSFGYYSEGNMKRWHRAYTGRITIIVMPLMVGQLLLTGYLAFAQTSWSHYVIFALTVFTWLTTFVFAVPLHASIDKKSNTKNERQQLMHINWYRTFAWTLLLIISIYNIV